VADVDLLAITAEANLALNWMIDDFFELALIAIVTENLAAIWAVGEVRF
jgi:hypothetical protein